MNVNIEFGDNSTLVTFKKKDVTSVDDLKSIIHMATSNHCFWTETLETEEFKKFMSGLKIRNTYAVAVGVDLHTKEPYVEWGNYKNSVTVY